MPVSLLILAVALAQPAPPAPAPVPAPTTLLVPGLQLGMTKAEFKARWPKLRAGFGPGCMAKLDPYFEHGKLDSVSMESARSDPAKTCGKFVRDWAEATYGKPKNSGDNGISGDCASGGITYSPLSQPAACGSPDTQDWISWLPEDGKLMVWLGVLRRGGNWKLEIDTK